MLTPQVSSKVKINLQQMILIMAANASEVLWIQTPKKTTQSNTQIKSPEAKLPRGKIPQLLVIITGAHTSGILLGPDPKEIIQCSKCFSHRPAPKYEILQLLVLISSANASEILLGSRPQRSYSKPLMLASQVSSEE